MTKAALKRLLKSEFFHEVEEVVKAWDYYLTIGNRKLADEMMIRFSIAKLALEHITGISYGFSRNGETYSVVNEKNQEEKIISGNSVKGKEVSA